MTDRRRLVTGIVVLLVANTLVNLYRVVPERLLLAALLPSIEIVVVALLVLLLPVGRARRAAWAVAPAVVVLALFGVVETFYRFIYRESVDPYADLAFVAPFLSMLTGIERLSNGAVILVVLLLVAALSAALALVARTLLAGASDTRRAVPIIVAVAVVALWGVRIVVLPAADPISLVAVRAFTGASARSGEVVEPEPTGVPGGAGGEATDTAREPTRDQDAPDAIAPTVEGTTKPPEPYLGRSDVTILVVESYGHTLFSRADHNERILPVYEELGEALAAEGITVFSALVRSPAFGGRSWLADGTILSGQWLGNQELYDAVFSRSGPNLPRDLAEAGYWTAVYAPAMTYFDEAFFDYYPFDESYVLDRLDYRGPVFEFGRLTDQFLIWRVQQNAAAARQAQPERPAFSFVMMVSSHVPFRLVPPFVEEWSDLGNGEIYNELERTWFDNNWLTGGEYPDGYTTSIAYSLRSAVEYATNFATDDELVVIIGDHQPRIPISEPESTYSVPMHLLSRNGDVLRRLGDRGLTPGLLPATDPEFMWMNEVYPLVLDLLTTVGE